MSRFVSWAKDWKNQKNYYYWLKEYTRPYLPRIVLLLLLDLAVTLLSTWMAVVSKNIIDKATGGNHIIGFLAVYAIMTFGMLFIWMVNGYIWT